MLKSTSIDMPLERTGFESDRPSGNEHRGKQTVIDLILTSRLVAILRLDDLTHAIPLVEALLCAGVQAIEFTLTNPDAPGVIAELRRVIPAFDQGLAAIGLGSVRNASEARLAIDSGAQFLVSPIAVEAIVETAKPHKIAVCLGAYSPTEIAMAWQFGADVVKVFPARGLGPGYIRDVLAPMPSLRLMPTGGVDLTNLHQYLDAGAVAVGVGGNFVDIAAIRERRWSDIEHAASEYVQAVKSHSKQR